MRYLVTAKVKPGNARALFAAVEQGTLGEGSVAEGEYLRDMAQARLREDGRVQWVETCFCPTPLLEERPYWEEYFHLLRVQDAHHRSGCRDENGSEPWACGHCDCTARLEERMLRWGRPFLEALGEAAGQGEKVGSGATGPRRRPRASARRTAPPAASRTSSKTA